jgi:hypothetical protein
LKQQYFQQPSLNIQNPGFMVLQTVKQLEPIWSGLYKKLNFRLIGTINSKPTVFDDTVYFLAFDHKQAADQALILLTSTLATNFYSSLIFWDEKRPVKTSILNSLNLSAIAEKLSIASWKS